MCADSQCGCGCDGSTGLGILAALTADQAVEEIFPAAKVRSGAGHDSGVRSLMVQAVQAGEMLDPSGAPGYSQSGDCAATGGSVAAKDLSLAAGAGGIGLQLVSKIGLIGAGPAGWIALGVSSVVGLFSTILNHHAQAVKKEQSILCAAVPAANNYLEIINKAVGEGLATPQQAISALDSLVSDFQSSVQPIIHGSDPTSSGECNAACVMLSQLRAIVAENKSAFQDMIAAAAQPTVSRPNTVTTQGGGVAPTGSSYASFYGAQPAAPVSSALPSWWPIAAIVAGALLFL